MSDRLDQYLKYHRKSAEVGDIDPAHSMLLYVCERFELNTEQRYWLAFLYAMTYCGASVYYVYNEFPDFENLDRGRLERWWGGGGRDAIICQTDRRWCRSNNQFVDAVESYRRFIGDRWTSARHGPAAMACTTRTGLTGTSRTSRHLTQQHLTQQPVGSVSASSCQRRTFGNWKPPSVRTGSSRTASGT